VVLSFLKHEIERDFSTFYTVHHLQHERQTFLTDSQKTENDYETLTIVHANGQGVRAETQLELTPWKDRITFRKR